MIGRLSSLLLLAWQLLGHLLAWPWRRGGQGGRLLQERYAADGLVPLTARDQQFIARLARCDGCGLCDSGCALLGSLDGAAPGPAYLVLTLSRAAPLLRDARLDLLPYAACAECGACTSYCPQEIPIDQVPGWASELLARLPARDAARGPAGGR
ncbi:MAG: hypothetical protein RBU45_09175 [Myxococcota bacterium]|jgi:Pyruvate/2-oxoacid:ferredoxin oxidoreductase delta subunit|nr:hypothetical protein [Myxococcota bacterium]